MKNRNRDSEELEAAAGGDEEAFARLYRLYCNQVHGFAYRMLGTQAAAEDVTHEAFMVLIEHPERYDAERGSVLTFLCAVARNQIFKHFRRRGCELEDFSSEEDICLVRDEDRPDPLTVLLDRELAEKVNESIALLPTLQREAVVLREFQEMTYDEISAVTGAEVNVVKARLYRARRSLIGHLSSYMSLREERCYELRKG